jgi:hypothetical protein
MTDASAGGGPEGPGRAAPWSWPPEADPSPPRPGGWRRLPPPLPAAPAEDQDDPAEGPVCANCGGRHPTPAGGLMAARLLPGPTPGGPVDPRQTRPAGWGRDRDRGGW